MQQNPGHLRTQRSHEFGSNRLSLFVIIWQGSVGPWGPLQRQFGQWWLAAGVGVRGWRQDALSFSRKLEVILLPFHATGLLCIHLVMSWIHRRCQVVRWYVNIKHLDLLPAFSRMCCGALDVLFYLLGVHKILWVTALQTVEVVLLWFN